jgi:hypothetical protein
MDAERDGVIAAYDDTDNFNAGQLNLSATVVPGHTYHVLLLAGFKTDTSPYPTLLASSYIKFTAAGAGGVLKLTSTPIVVDVKFSGGPDGDRYPGRIAKTVGLDKEQTYTLEYRIGSDNRGVQATDDALKDGINDGLWPLKLASAEVRNIDTWFYKYSAVNPDTGLRETLTSYQPGVLDLVPVPLNNSYGTNLAWVKWGNNKPDVMNDLSVNANKQTTGHGKYEFTTRSEVGMTGAVWFNLEYVPFGIFDDEMWQRVSGSERPVWVIRNGLNDNVPASATDFVTNGTGAIRIGVVDPTAPIAGVYEDSNPWPIEDTAVDADAPAEDDLKDALTFLDANGAAARYGTYTIKLGGAGPSAPVNRPAWPDQITLGGDDSAEWKYPAIKQTAIIIEEIGGVITLPVAARYWTLNDSDTVRYGTNIITAGLADSPVKMSTVMSIVTSGGTIDGNPVDDTTLLISLGEATLTATLAGDVSSWFGNNTLSGLSYTIVSATAGSEFITIKISGLPSAMASVGDSLLVIPQGALTHAVYGLFNEPVEVTGLVQYEISMDFDYIGADSPFAAPKNGAYRLEVWGAQGGAGTISTSTTIEEGGKGGYSVGETTLTSGATLYVYVGQGLVSELGVTAYNGGGSGARDISINTAYEGAGGGGTDIRTSQNTTYADRIIVAGGGGGASVAIIATAGICGGLTGG